MKTNNVINWFVVNKFGAIVEDLSNRKLARIFKNFMNAANPDFGPYRIAKVVVAK